MNFFDDLPFSNGVYGPLKSGRILRILAMNAARRIILISEASP